MSTLTISETLFCQLCSSAGVSCTRIEAGDRPSPDFQIAARNVQAVCEIKQLDPSPEDLAELKEAQEQGTAGRFLPNRIRQKLKRASRQLKRSSTTRIPTLLVIYDNTPFKMYTSDGEVLQAMFGRSSVVVSFPVDSSQSLQVSDTFFGEDRGLGPERNTSVSAVAILDDPPDRPASLRVYINPYASVPFPEELLDQLPVSLVRRPGDLVNP